MESLGGRAAHGAWPWSHAAGPPVADKPVPCDAAANAVVRLSTYSTLNTPDKFAAVKSPPARPMPALWDCPWETPALYVPAPECPIERLELRNSFFKALCIGAHEGAFHHCEKTRKTEQMQGPAVCNICRVVIARATEGGSWQSHAFARLLRRPQSAFGGLAMTLCI